MKRLRIVALVLLLATVGTAALTWPNEQRLHADESPVLFEATVQAVEDCDSQDTATSCTIVDVALTEGRDAGQIFRLPEVIDTNDPLQVGDEIIVATDQTTDGGFRYTYVDRQRLPVLAVLVGAAALCLLLVGRLRGFGALASIAAIAGAVGLYAFPALVEGSEPLLIAGVAGAFVTMTSIYLTNRFSPLTTVAVIGALAGLGLMVLLSWLVSLIGEFGGIGPVQALGLDRLGSVDPRGLFIAGIIIGTSGALGSVTASHASTALAIRTANPALSARQLFTATLNEERPRLFSTINTLVLAYAGAAIPVLLLFAASDASIRQTVNGEIVAIEIARIATGLIGLAIAAPLTTWLAVAVLNTNEQPAPAITAPADTDERPPVRRNGTKPQQSVLRRTPTEPQEPAKADQEPSLWQRMRQGLDD